MSETDVPVTELVAEPEPTSSLQDVLTLRVDEGERRIYLTEAISCDLLADAMRSVTYLQDASEEAIELWISSPGGDGEAALGFLDIMDACDCEIVTVGVGSVCSSAAFILANGDRRIVYPRTQVLLHGPTFSGIEDAGLEDVRAIEGRTAWLTEQTILLLQDKTHLKEQAHEILTSGKDYYFRGAQIVDAGIADAMIAPSL